MISTKFEDNVALNFDKNPPINAASAVDIKKRPTNVPRRLIGSSLFGAAINIGAIQASPALNSNTPKVISRKGKCR